MGGELNKILMDRLVANATKERHIYGAVFHVSSDDNSIDLISASGDIEEGSRYYIASVNKLFVSAIILRLYAKNELDLSDKISGYLPEEVVGRIHLYGGRDYSRELSIAHLMSHTSGLPCYLADTQASGKRAIAELEAGIDQPWPIDKVICEVKMMRTHFPPGTDGRARYADTNHRILGLVIENIAGEPVNIVLTDMFRELNMTETYVCEDVNDKAFAPIRYKSETRNIPLFLTSTRDDIVSTATDQMIFLKAFFGGHFLPKKRLCELEKWNTIFFPFRYGIGVQKFRLPRILSSFRAVPDMVGHCGSTGSVAFWVPDRNVYITGTVNQQARPNVAFQTLIRIVSELK